MSDTNGAEPDPHIPFQLTEFFPYKARRFYTRIRDHVARLYQDAYDLKRYEWRVLAILGGGSVLTPIEIARLTDMDKVSVSRAITRLSARGWVVSRDNKADGRSRFITVSTEGRRIYRDLVPQMILAEQDLLAPLDPEEREMLIFLMDKVLLGMGDTPAGSQGAIRSVGRAGSP